MLQFKKRVLSTVCKRQDQEKFVQKVEKEILTKEELYEQEHDMTDEEEEVEVGVCELQKKFDRRNDKVWKRIDLLHEKFNEAKLLDDEQ